MKRIRALVQKRRLVCWWSLTLGALAFGAFGCAAEPNTMTASGSGGAAGSASGSANATSMAGTVAMTSNLAGSGGAVTTLVPNIAGIGGGMAEAEPTPAAADAGLVDAAPGGVVLEGIVPIMVVGSSNETQTCWRAFLWQKLHEAGVTNFDFVGRVVTGPDCGVPEYDQDVEAQPGTIFTDFTADDFATRFSANPPRIVLVHVAGADARNGIPTSEILDAFSLAVEEARRVSPNVIFFVAQHTPQIPATGIDALNAGIPGWAAQISTAESPVAAVDLFSGIVPDSDQSDGTHLNDAGSEKVAGWWLEVLLPLFKP